MTGLQEDEALSPIPAGLYRGTKFSRYNKLVGANYPATPDVES